MAHLLIPDNTTGNSADAADSVATSITGDIDVRLRLSQDDWTPSATRYLFCKGSGGSGDRAWRFQLTTAGAVLFNWYPAGASAAPAPDSGALGFTDGTDQWIRATVDVDNGAGGYDLKYWTADGSLTSPTAGDFSQVGSTYTGTGTTSIFDSTVGISVGSLLSGAVAGGAGKYYRAQVYSGIAGTLQFDADPSDEATWNGAKTLIIENANSAVVTLQGDAELVPTTSVAGYTAHDPNAFYAAVKTRLEGQTSKNVGRGEAPSDLTLPYAVVYPLNEADDPNLNGTLNDPHLTTVFEWQVTSVGGTAEQAEWMQQKVRSALLGWSPTGDYGLVEKSGGQGTRRDDGVQPAQFFAVDTFTVFAS